MIKEYDFVIIGGGIFGAYAALFLSKSNKVLIIEKEKDLFSKASTINQARIHSGYHYPRSVSTAKLSDENKLRFISDHEKFINNKFEHFYGIDNSSSYTDSFQFERFCDLLKIKAKKVTNKLFNTSRIEQLYLTDEGSFDPILIAEFYKKEIKKNKNITVLNSTQIIKAEKEDNHWKLITSDQKNTKIISYNIINSTYSSINQINELFNLQEIELTHEICEIAFVTSNRIKNIGVTIMDGHFCSLMPYGLSELLSLSSVSYTPHKVSKNNIHNFKCDFCNTYQPSFTETCKVCKKNMNSNSRKMTNQIKMYLNDDVNLDYLFSNYTIKSKLKSSHIDDSRPTEISKLNENPPFYCLFSGKINSIYEIEKIIE